MREDNKRESTIQEQFKEVERAFIQLLTTIGIGKVVDWLNNKIGEKRKE